MTSHHFIGEGDFSDRLRAACGDTPSLLAAVAGTVREAGLHVVAEQAVPFTGGGATLVWVLAESHLVLHLWPELGLATVDLHVCDYRDSNRVKAHRLRDALAALCFAPGSAAWRELAAETPRSVADRDHEAEYRGFWADVGAAFPDLAGARSTTQYRNDEQWLLRTQFPPLEGLWMLKTDLWDEAKNTHILRWAAARGARVIGVDISPAVTRAARRGFAAAGRRLLGAQGDVRALPFRSGSVDAVYSMGTIEHFDDTEQAVREIFRVLRPGGRAIIGVPNRHDPFLRPLLVVLLYRLGLYGYGFEKSYSRRALRGMLERAGFDVTAETGILFIPGWLRMLDLACHAWLRPLAALTGALCAPFDWLSRRYPCLRRHGYLIAAVGVRPSGGAPCGSRSRGAAG